MNGSCKQCRDGVALDFDFTMAFQPIVDLGRKVGWGYEALVRGVDGAGAGQILSNVTPENRYRFDQACRVKAIELAARLFPADDTRLSINFMPNAVYDPAACIRTTLAAAGRSGFSLDRIMFEFTENEPIVDTAHVKRIIAEYQRRGFMTAIDDFGAGFAGLKLLANFQPDLVKIDMELVRDIDTSPARQAIVAGIMGICRQLDITVLAEGIETEAELAVQLGVSRHTVRQAIAQLRKRGMLAARKGAEGTDAFSLLAEVGRDCVGALQFLPEGEAAGPAGASQGRPVTDEEIAALLTYIRRGFGNDADPVTPETVAGVRAETADRATPWTEAELLDIP